MAKNKPVMTASTVQKKDYSYEIGGTSLRFTLRTDVKIELKAFLELMERAREDIQKDLAALN